MVGGIGLVLYAEPITYLGTRPRPSCLLFTPCYSGLSTLNS